MSYFFESEDGSLLSIGRGLHLDRLVLRPLSSDSLIARTQDWFLFLRMPWVHRVVPLVLGLVKFGLHLWTFCLFLIQRRFWTCFVVSLPSIGFLGSIRCGTLQAAILMNHIRKGIRISWWRLRTEGASIQGKEC